MSVSDKDSLVVARSERTPPAAKLERTPADKPLPPPERLALAERNQRTARPMSVDRPYHPPRRISPLTRRILFFNAFALFILIGGVLGIQTGIRLRSIEQWPKLPVVSSASLRMRFAVAS